MPQLRIAHLVGSLHNGGLERILVRVVCGTEGEDLHHHVVCIRDEGPLRDAVPATAEVQSLGYAKGFHWRGVWRIARCLRKKRIGVLHTRNQTALIWGGLARLLCPGVRHIHSEHGTPVDARPLTRLLARRADVLMTVSPAMIPEMRAFYGLPEDREIVVIPNGVDTEKFRPAAHEIHENSRKGAGERKHASAHGTHGKTQKERGASDGANSSANNEQPTTNALRSSLGLPEETVLFACIGRMDENKNQELAIRAFAEVISSKSSKPSKSTKSIGKNDRSSGNENRGPQAVSPEFHDFDGFDDLVDFDGPAALLLIGDGPERARLEEAAEQCSVFGVRCSGNQEPRPKNQEPRILFLGHRDDLPDILPQIDVLLLPSKREGMSNAILEANACGVPVLASDIPANRCLIRDGVNGYLLPIGSPTNHTKTHEKEHRSTPRTERKTQSTKHKAQSTKHEGLTTNAWSQAMADLAADAEKRRALGTAARDLVTKEYSLARMLERYTEIYVGKDEANTE